MLKGERILVTGPAGQIAFPLASALARDNEVWGLARFSEPGSRQRVEEAGIRPVEADLATGDLSGVPPDVDRVLHLASFIGPGEDFDHALRINAEGTAALLAHCRGARSVLVMSTASVYRPHPDPHHRYTETDPLGDAVSTHAPTYAISKIAQEAVARSCARLFDVPVVIARMNSAYGANGGLPAYQLDWMVAGEPVVVRHDPCPYSPIHEDDIIAQASALLEAASVPATIVNWGGDDVVSPQEWCPYLAELAGLDPPRLVVTEVPGSQPGVALDVTRRREITGPCTVSWRDGMRRMLEARYPDGVVPGQPAEGQAARLLASTRGAGAGDRDRGGSDQ